MASANRDARHHQSSGPSWGGWRLIPDGPAAVIGAQVRRAPRGTETLRGRSRLRLDAPAHGASGRWGLGASPISFVVAARRPSTRGQAAGGRMDAPARHRRPLRLRRPCSEDGRPTSAETPPPPPVGGDVVASSRSWARRNFTGNSIVLFGHHRDPTNAGLAPPHPTRIRPS